MEEEEKTKKEIVKNFSSDVIEKIRDLISYFSVTKKPKELIDETTKKLGYIEGKTEEKITNISNLLSMTKNSITNEKNQVKNLERGIELLNEARAHSNSEKLKEEIEERKRYIKILKVRKQILNSQLFLLNQYRDMISENLDAIKKLGEEKISKKGVGKKLALRIMLGIASSLILGFSGFGAVGVVGAFGNLPIG